MKGAATELATVVICHEVGTKERATALVTSPMDLLVGQEGGRPVDYRRMALAILAANDHVDEWDVPDERDLGEQGRLLANYAHYARFNRGGDALNELVRGALMFERPPAQGPLSEPAEFASFSSPQPFRR